MSRVRTPHQPVSKAHNKPRVGVFHRVQETLMPGVSWPRRVSHHTDEAEGEAVDLLVGETIDVHLGEGERRAGERVLLGPLDEFLQHGQEAAPDFPVRRAGRDERPQRFVRLRRGLGVASVCSGGGERLVRGTGGAGGGPGGAGGL